jgi:alkylhydroperoxidase family enzyme
VHHLLRLNATPWRVRPRHVRSLRRNGFSEREILDATWVAALFAFYNRVAEGLGIDLEDFMKPRATDSARGRNP